jgi:hypothetical protein
LGTVVVVELDAVTVAALGDTVLPVEVVAWANAVAPTATPAAAPMPTANFKRRRRGAG